MKEYVNNQTLDYRDDWHDNMMILRYDAEVIVESQAWFAMLLSIIIPLYNCAAYVERCILSIYDQGLNNQDFEVIVINDGSTDGGEKIVEKLARTCTNLILLSQENKGLSAVRNRGVEVARGRYVEFLDADDYLIPCGMSRLLKTAVDNDVKRSHLSTTFMRQLKKEHYFSLNVKNTKILK